MSLNNKTVALPFTSAEVCLVSMPYHNPHLPSLALGLLQAALMAEGIETRSVYANLLFNEQLGHPLYNRHHVPDPRLPLAEWSFSPLAFPGFDADEGRFIKATYPLLGRIRRQTIEAYREELRFVRRQAEVFISDLAEKILSLSPRIVGCTSSLAQKVPSLALLRKIRELDPKVVTLMGGADCETVMGLAAHQHFTWLDYIVSGEGEDLIVPLVNSIFEFNREVPPDRLSKGVFAPCHRDSGYLEIKEQGEDSYRAVAESFGRQRLPLYQDYFDTLALLPTLSGLIRPSLPIQASRGCWYGKCKFCGLNAPEIPYRSRPSEDVLSEMDELNDRHGVTHFEFLDNVLAKGHIDDLLPKLADRGAPYKLFYEIRSDLSKKQIASLRAAGVVICQPGIESLHSEALRAMKKGVTSWQNIQTLKWCRQYGIKAKWSIIHDLPGDQDHWYREMAELVPLLAHLSEPMGMLEVQYQRYSHYFDHADEYGLKLEPLSLDSLIYPLSEEVIKNLSYTLDDRFSAGVRDNPGLAILFARPGLRNLKKAVIRWMMGADNRNGPMLSMKVADDKIVISDSRSVATASSFQLDGAEREIYLLCDEARPEEQVRRLLLDKGYNEQTVDTGIHSLLEKKVMLRVDRRLLALALEEPVLEYISPDQNPMGWVSI